MLVSGQFGDRLANVLAQTVTEGHWGRAAHPAAHRTTPTARYTQSSPNSNAPPASDDGALMSYAAAEADMYGQAAVSILTKIASRRRLGADLSYPFGTSMPRAALSPT